MSEPIVTIMEQIYNGDLHPAEQVLPKKPEYKKACSEFANLTSKMKEQFSEDNYELLEQVLTLHAIIENFENLEFLRYGMSLGLKLMQEASEIM